MSGAKINKLSPEWKAIKAILTEEIEEALSSMEAGLDHEAYQFARGQIALARKVIETVEPTTPVEEVATEDHYGISDPDREY